MMLTIISISALSILPLSSVAVPSEAPAGGMLECMRECDRDIV